MGVTDEELKNRDDFSKKDSFIDFFDRAHEAKVIMAAMSSESKQITTAVYGSEEEITWLLTNFFVRYPELINAYLTVIIRIAQTYKEDNPDQYEWYIRGLKEFLNDVTSKI
jgi:hypothetical protein